MTAVGLDHYAPQNALDLEFKPAANNEIMNIEPIQNCGTQHYNLSRDQLPTPTPIDAYSNNYLGIDIILSS